MAKCTFCGKNIVQGRGLALIEASGKIVNLCSGKCRKNRKMGRDPNKLKWIRKMPEHKAAK